LSLHRTSEAGDFERIDSDDEGGDFERIDSDDEGGNSKPTRWHFDNFEPIDSDDGDDLRTMPPHMAVASEDGDFEPMEQDFGDFEPIPFADELELEQLYLDPEKFSQDFPGRAEALSAEFGIPFKGVPFAEKVLAKDLSLVACCTESGNVGPGWENLSPVRETDYQVRTKAAADLVRMDSDSRNRILLNTLRTHPQMLSNLAMYARNPDTFYGDFAVVADRAFGLFRALPEQEKRRLLERGFVSSEDIALLLQH
jgi:hypothetical protein